MVENDGEQDNCDICLREIDLGGRYFTNNYKSDDCKSVHCECNRAYSY